MRDPRSFWHELRRRKVWRTAAVYAAVAWGVLQLADVVWEPLGIPPWTMTLLIVLVVLGFPLVLTLEWVYEVSRDGVRRTSHENYARAGGSVTVWPMAVGGAVMLLVGLGMWRMATGGSGADSEPPMRQAAVVLFPCEIRGSAAMAHMAEGLVHLLASRFQQGSDLLRPVDPRSVLSFLDREAPEALDSEVAHRYARRLGAGHYVRCDVLELFEGELQVKAALYRLGAEEPVVDAAVEGSASELLALADELAGRIIAGSVGSASRLAREAARTAEPVPLEAWKAYVEGERAFRNGRHIEAMARLREAVAADSTFALAHYRLAVASNWAEQRLEETKALTQALAHADRLSPLDRMLVEAYNLYAQGSHAEAKRRYGDITRAYPGEIEGWYVLGEVLFHYGWLSAEPISRAESVLSRAAQLDPGNHYHEVLLHLIHIAVSDDGPDRLDSLAARVAHGSPWVREALLLGRADTAAVDSAIRMVERGEASSFLLADLAPSLDIGERLADAFANPERSQDLRARAHLKRAGIRVARGDWDGAVKAVDRAARLRPALALELKAYMALAAPPGLEGIDLGAIRREMEGWDPPADEPLPSTRSPDAPHTGLHPWLRLYLLGLLEARAGDTASALERAAALGGAEAPERLEEWLRDLEAIVRAEVARAAGDPARALELLEGAPLWTVYRLDPRYSPILAHFHAVVLRAELLLELDRPHEALRWYRGLDHPFWMPTDAIGTRVIVGRALAHEAIGDRHGAQTLRQAVAERWPGAPTVD
jgi:tetratricopeptide (TPR) repeat protein